jgi:2-polyprenyl-3-methyl-5-hydroxy-6-metoxy-1,4-benzoquinol methylase
MTMLHEQAHQDNQYAFPYHYVPKIKDGSFRQCFNLSWGYEYLSYIDFVAQQATGIGFSSLLDVGCGDGRLLADLYENYSERRLVGLDYSARAIGLARAMAAGPEFVVGDVSDESLFEEKFDVVTLVETLEHIPPDHVASFVAALASQLKHEGSLILTVPSKNVKLHKKHFQHFDRTALERVLAPHFKDIEFHFINRTEESLLLRAIKATLTNKLFILNNAKWLRMIYKLYLRNLFHGNATNTKRVCVVARKK